MKLNIHFLFSFIFLWYDTRINSTHVDIESCADQTRHQYARNHVARIKATVAKEEKVNPGMKTSRFVHKDRKLSRGLVRSDRWKLQARVMEIGGSSPAWKSREGRPAYRFIGIYLQLAGHGLPNFDLITRNTRALVASKRDRDYIFMERCPNVAEYSWTARKIERVRCGTDRWEFFNKNEFKILWYRKL